MKTHLRTAIMAVMLLTAATALAQSEKITWVQGTVSDARTGEPLPFVQVGFVGTTIGTSTSMDGRFQLSNTTGHDSIRLQMMGYESTTVKVRAGTVTKGLKISMHPKATKMETVHVTASRKGGTRYRRRDNPAVELAEKVIGNKGRNRIESAERYRRDIYEKTTLALDDFHPDFEKNRFWRKMAFVEKYIDQTPFDATPILTISMRETMMQQSYRKKPHQDRTLLTARRMEGLDQLLGQEGIEESLEGMFVPIDIYDDDIELMMNHFVGPLNSAMATVFYKYYITDTVTVDKWRCVELSFVPANERSFGFTGQMYIRLDGSYGVAKYSMTVSPYVNMNFVRDLTIIQEYEERGAAGTDSALLVPTRCDTYGRMFIHKRLQEVYAHNVRVHSNYNISDTAEMLADSLFAPYSSRASLPKTFMRRKIWNQLRPIELTVKETMIDSLRYELARLPGVQRTRKVAETLLTGYVPTNGKRDSSRVDIGPIYNALSYNPTEGWRIRLGAMTTATLSNSNFAEGYAAYGFADKRMKFNLKLTHTFDEKKRYAHEPPLGSVSLTASHELEAPGQRFDDFDRDNILMSTNREQKLQYVTQGVARVQKQWKSGMRAESWVAVRRTEPAGLLHYTRINADGTTENVAHFEEAEWTGKAAFSPATRDADNRRTGSMNMTELGKRRWRIELAQTAGVMSGGLRYGRTDLRVDNRLWLSAFGYIDTRLQGSIVEGRLPYPRLNFPTGSGSIFITSSGFNTMRPMEFAMDRYASLLATYHMKGWLLGYIPLVKRLRLREVLGAGILYGELTDRNNPEKPSGAGLFVLPEGTTPIGGRPYVEWSVGVENILKFIRIDYVRRVTYTEGLSNRQKGFFKVALKFTL